eukprot:1664831-Pleurochrysis_carterae.AAC.1
MGRAGDRYGFRDRWESPARFVSLGAGRAGRCGRHEPVCQGRSDPSAAASGRSRPALLNDRASGH